MRYIIIRPLFTSGHSFISPNICEISGEINMEIWINGKNQKIIATKMLVNFSIALLKKR